MQIAAGMAPTNQPTFPAMCIAGAGEGAGVQVGALQLPTQPLRTPTGLPKGTCLRISCSASRLAHSNSSVVDAVCMLCMLCLLCMVCMVCMVCNGLHGVHGVLA